MTKPRTPLMLAAFELGRSYDATRRMLFRGELTGARIDGKWFVDGDSLEQAKRERRKAERKREASSVASTA